MSPPYIVRSEPEWIAHPYPPIEWLIEGCLFTPSVNMIWGWRGIGKTFWNLSLAIAIASGGSLVGWPVTKARSVLYVDGEMAPSMVQRRWEKLKKGMTDGDPLLLEKNFHMLSHSDQEGGIKDLATPSGRKKLEAVMEPFDVTFIDNCSSTIKSGDPNNEMDWKPIGEWSALQRTKGKTVVWVHHGTKPNQDGYSSQRGTSGREDNLDLVIELRHFKPKRKQAFQIVAEKTRGFEEWDPFGVKITDFGEGTRIVKWSPPPKDGPAVSLTRGRPL